MPQVSWNELNDVIHNVKNSLTKLVGVEMMCKKSELMRQNIKQELIKELDKLQDIVLEQADEEN